ncbi:unnamed protein product [Thlaspi arvense]|uniref:Defensin-like protein n=1 Tax=Thlaspi arvense TaxID=13288 RepID=A0AAU9SZW2_THLAR|nr:unnamed protein product [Thlaspi arvense]
MAKATSVLVLPIIFLVMFALVQQMSACMAVIGSCRDIRDCDGTCKSKFGIVSSGYCDHVPVGYGACICSKPCPKEKTLT